MKLRAMIRVGAISIIASGTFVYFALKARKKSHPSSIDNKVSSDKMVTRQNQVVSRDDIGLKPEKNPRDGSLETVKDFIKSRAKNPSSFDFFEWSDIVREGNYWKVRCKYRGISSFGAEVTTNAWFYIRNGKVVHTKTISKI